MSGLLRRLIADRAAKVELAVALLLVGAMLVAPPVLAQEKPDIEIDAVSEAKTSSATSLTWQHTVGSGSNRYLYVGVSLRGSSSSSPRVTVQSVTYGGSTLQSVGAQDRGTNVRVQSFELIGPPTGSANIVVTLSDDGLEPPSTVSAPIIGGAISLFNVNQTDPRRTQSSTQGTSSSISVFTGSTARDLIVDTLAAAGDVTATVGSSQVERWNDSAGTSPVRGTASTMPATGAGQTLSWTLSSSTDWAYAYAVLVPADAPTLAKIREAEVLPVGEGHLLTWRTSMEHDNLGFRISRELADGTREPATSSLVAGSALFAGQGRTLASGRTYRWLDREGPARGAVRYWIEDVSLGGSSGSFEPVLVPQADPAVAPAREQAVAAESPMLAGLGLKSTAAGQNGTPRPVIRVPPRGPAPGAMAQQWRIANTKALRIGVREEGWYQITFAEIRNAGLEPGPTGSGLRLFTDGREIPAKVVLSEAEQHDGGTVEFFGFGLDTPGSDTRVFWLLVDDHSAQRLALAPSRSGAQGPEHYRAQVRRSDRSVYFAALLDEERDNFFGPVVTGTPTTIPLFADALAMGGLDADLTIAVQGATAGRHRVNVSLNGNMLGQLELEGLGHVVESFAFEQGVLREGANDLTLTTEGGEFDVVLVDFVELGFQRRYMPVADSFLMSAPSLNRISLDGFAAGDVRVVDVSDPWHAVEVPVEVQPSEAGFRAVLTTLPPVRLAPRAPGRSGFGIDSTRLMLAFTSAAVKAPVFVELSEPSSWNRDEHRADLVIVSHSLFLEAAGRLAEHRRAEGLDVVVVDVQEAFDEFSFGMKSAKAIRDLLARATSTWQTAPSYVLLFGDASLDPRDYLGLGSSDFVPTPLVAGGYLKTAADDWFADLDGDGVATLAVGRLPVRSSAEAGSVVDRLIAYDSLTGQEAWAGKVALIADADDPDLVEINFEEMISELSTLVGEGLDVVELRTGSMTRSAARAQIIDTMNEGALMVAFAGHGSADIWGKRNIFSSVEAHGLTNRDMLPVVVALNCLNGFFQDVYTESLAEALLRSTGGGAIAVVASSALTDPSGQHAFARNLVAGALDGGQPRLGDVVLGSKSGLTDKAVRRSFMLFGDPTMRLPR